MMINSPKEADLPLKLEGHSSSDHEKAKATSSSSSTQWPRLKDPRIVRVSKAFGGKDRHSKVCTIRGLRDRRVRLSVPTAIHLYDLQDRLRLNQPSKVVDWLLNAAKHEIDELPPLRMPPPGTFTLGSHPSLVTSNEVSTSYSIQWKEVPCQNSTIWKSKSTEVSGDEMATTEKENWINTTNDEDKQGSNECTPGAHVLPNNNLLPRPINHASFLGLLNTIPLGNYQFEPSAQLGNHGFTNQTDIINSNINVVPFPTLMPLSTGNTSQIMPCPPEGSTQSYFPSQVSAMEMINHRQINHHHQMLQGSSSQNLLKNSLNNIPSFSQQMKHFSLALMTPKLCHSPNRSESESQSHKDQDFPTN